MKLKYIFTALIATLALAVSCEKEADRYLEQIQLSTSYVSLPVAGGTAQMTITATENWAFQPVITEKGVDGKLTLPSWLSASATSGSAGQTTITFSAAAGEGRTAELQISCGGKTQFVNVIQGLATVSIATCADVIAGPDSKTFRVTGICTGIYNTTYGNWYLTDDTGTITIYGTLDAKGNTKNFLSLGLEVGDEVTVEGPKTTYGTTIELVDVTVIKINKSLIKVNEIVYADPELNAIAIEGGDAQVLLTNKGTTGIDVTIPDEAKSWLGVTTVDAASGIVTLTAQPNAGGDRSAVVTFGTTDGKKSYSTEATIEQKGAIKAITAADFNNLPDGSALYRIKGVITQIVMDKNDPTKYNKYGNFYIQDGTGLVYVYGLLPEAKGASGQDVLTKMNAKVGDVITVVGPKGSYKDAPQMVNAYCEEHVPATAISAVDFNKLEDGAALYQVSGVITQIVMDKNDPTKYNKYGNFYIQDESGEKVYVYGLVPALDGKSGTDMLTTLGVKVNDRITVVGPKGSYKGAAQMVNAFYVSHQPADEGGGEGGEGGEGGDELGADFTSTVTWTKGESAFDDGLATVNNVSDVKTLKLGTSSKNGTATLTVHAGAKEVSFIGVGWKGSQAKLTANVAGSEKVFEVAANEGASGSAPYTMTVTLSDKYTITFDSALTADTEIPIASTGRVILFAIKSK